MHFSTRSSMSLCFSGFMTGTPWHPIPHNAFPMIPTPNTYFSVAPPFQWHERFLPGFSGSPPPLCFDGDAKGLLVLPPPRNPGAVQSRGHGGRWAMDEGEAAIQLAMMANPFGSGGRSLSDNFVMLGNCLIFKGDFQSTVPPIYHTKTAAKGGPSRNNKSKTTAADSGIPYKKSRREGPGKMQRPLMLTLNPPARHPKIPSRQMSDRTAKVSYNVTNVTTSKKSANGGM
ncbi:hypothetical protein BC829DRAFT_476953 [Chytridium lagenaria]|nr:hypothetical protein BC829DRAFT_476953 [Chytridium lagenaria]